MLLSVALIILISLMMAKIFNLMKLPAILGMLLAGMILGPYILNLIDGSIMDLSGDLREIALIVILIRAGLSLHVDDLKKVGRPAILLSFVPATIEIIAITFLAPLFFDIDTPTALVLGAVVAAVSPAVVVPRMIKLMESGYGREKRIPHMILASASIDDVYVIVLFYAFLQLTLGDSFHISTLINIPISIGLGILVGIMVGYFSHKFFKIFHMRDTVKVLIIFAIGFLFMSLEDALSDLIPMSGLLAVMAYGIAINHFYPSLSKRLVKKFEKIWVVAEIMLFVLVGALVNLTVLADIGLFAVILINIAVLFRLIGVFISLIKTNLNAKERLFTAGAYTPKATVQAAIGAIPLSMGLPNGELILMVSVLAIIITAPLGAIFIDIYHKILLKKA